MVLEALFASNLSVEKGLLCLALVVILITFLFVLCIIKYVNGLVV